MEVARVACLRREVRQLPLRRGALVVGELRRGRGGGDKLDERDLPVGVGVDGGHEARRRLFVALALPPDALQQLWRGGQLGGVERSRRVAVHHTCKGMVRDRMGRDGYGASWGETGSSSRKR